MVYIIVFLARYLFHYLFSVGSYFAPWAEYRDGIICLIPYTVPTAFATIISRKSFEKTGTIWTGTFVNAFIITLVQVNNTSTFVLLH